MFRLLFFLLPASIILPQATKWMAIGDLHSWYSAAGCEIEVGRIASSQDGLRWPAFYRSQDNQAAKGLWLGAVNFHDPVVNKDYAHKVVHAGPRHLDIENETMPLDISMVGRFDHPNVFVDGDPASNLQYLDAVDEVDPSLLSDRKLVNKVQTSLGVEMTRIIYAFSHPKHQNYHIQEYDSSGA